MYFNSISNLHSLLFKIMVLWLGVDVNLSVLRLSANFFSINQEVFGAISNGVNFVFLVLALLSIFFERKIVKKDILIIVFILFLCVQGGTVGFLNHGLTESTFKHVYMVFFVLGFVFFGVILSRRIDRLDIFLPVFNVALFLNTIATFFYMIISNFFVLYPGYGTHALGYLIIYYFYTGRFFLLFVSFFFLVLQGKRSILLMILVTMLLAFFFRKKISFSKILFSFLSVLCFMFLIFYLIEFFNLNSFPGLDRMKYINPFSDSFDVVLGSSGRFDEVVSAFNVFVYNDLNWFFGSGFGFLYEWKLGYGSHYSEVKGYLHNVPLMVLFIFGLPVFMLIYGLFVCVFLRSRRFFLYKKEESMSLCIGFFSMAFLYFVLSSLFSLNSLSDPLGWVFLGLCLGVNRNYEQKILVAR